MFSSSCCAGVNTIVVLPNRKSILPVTAAVPFVSFTAGPRNFAGSIGSEYLTRTTALSAIPLPSMPGDRSITAGGVRSTVVKPAANGAAITLPTRSAMPLMLSVYRVFSLSGAIGVNTTVVSPSISCSVPRMVVAGPVSLTLDWLTVPGFTGSEKTTRTADASGTPTADACGIRVATAGAASSSVMSPRATVLAACTVRWATPGPIGSSRLSV